MSRLCNRGMGRRLIQGNEACALAAIRAGCRFFAGYPITPSSEIAEILAKELPRIGGYFIQMEDELGSLGAVLGASLGGLKAMTATSGPGFSLMQENLGYGIMGEIPCVVVDVQRGGPSTGLPTRPAQGDVMQARWGTHGDHQIIVLAPSNVAETYLTTIKAFNLSEQFRTPVVLLLDEIVGHINERIEIPEDISIVTRKGPSVPPAEYLPYDPGFDVPPMANFGSGYRYHVTGLVHGPSGFPTNDARLTVELLSRLNRKISDHRDEIVDFKGYYLEDARIVVVAYGSSARSCRAAVRSLREGGINVGLFQPLSIWPFPNQELKGLNADHYVVVEMNLGQIWHEVGCITGKEPVLINRIDGEMIEPAMVEEAICSIT